MSDCARSVFHAQLAGVMETLLSAALTEIVQLFENSLCEQQTELRQKGAELTQTGAELAQREAEIAALRSQLEEAELWTKRTVGRGLGVMVTALRQDRSGQLGAQDQGPFHKRGDTGEGALSQTDRVEQECNPQVKAEVEESELEAGIFSVDGTQVKEETEPHLEFSYLERSSDAGYQCFKNLLPETRAKVCQRQDSMQRPKLPSEGYPNSAVSMGTGWASPRSECSADMLNEWELTGEERKREWAEFIGERETELEELGSVTEGSGGFIQQTEKARVRVRSQVTPPTHLNDAPFSSSGLLSLKHAENKGRNLISQGRKVFAPRLQPNAHTTHTHSPGGTRPYTCPYCGKGFTYPSHQRRHLLRHTGERLHPCPLCDKSFLTPSELTVHTRVHTGERPYRCAQCGKSFARSGNLRAHQRDVHLGKRPFSCTDCGKRFAHKGNLRAHCRRLHQGEPNSCLTLHNLTLSHTTPTVQPNTHRTQSIN